MAFAPPDMACPAIVFPHIVFPHIVFLLEPIRSSFPSSPDMFGRNKSASESPTLPTKSMTEPSASATSARRAAQHSAAVIAG
jgi:hypothetical protein